MISLFVAIFSTALILFASKLSYKNYVKRESENHNPDDRDFIDKVYDPYDLYSDENQADMNEKEILNDNKKHIGLLKNKKEIFKTLPVHFSIFRIFAYIIFVIGFISLKDNNLLEIGYYILGVTIAILSMAFIPSIQKK